MEYKQFWDNVWINYSEYVPLFYDPEVNRFFDTDGFVIDYIYDYITPHDLAMFLNGEGDLVVPHRKLPDVGVELYYPDPCEFCPDYDDCYGYNDIEEGDTCNEKKRAYISCSIRDGDGHRISSCENSV